MGTANRRSATQVANDKNSKVIRKEGAPRSGLRVIFIELDGEEVRPKDAMWIVYNPKGVPVNFFTSDVATLDDVSRAARVFWVGGTDAIKALNLGYSLELVSPNRFIKEIAKNLREDDTPTAALESGRRSDLV